MSHHLIIHKTCLQGRFQTVSIREEKTKQAIWRKNHTACFLCYYICRKVFSQTEQSGRENEKWRTKKALLGLFSFSIEKRFWRRHPDLNWGSRCCRPMPYHLAIAPYWSGLRGSNSLPPPWQGGALPDELNPQWRSGWDSNPRPLP